MVLLRNKYRDNVNPLAWTLPTGKKALDVNPDNIFI